jgi:hypothetical protein
MTTVETQRETFTRLLPELEAIALAHFRGIGPEAQDEAIQNTTCLAWKYWLRLIQKGQVDDEGLLRSVWWYCIRQTKVGRTIGVGSRKGRCRQDAYSRGVSRTLERIDFDGFVADSTPIPDQVAFRLDLPRFLATLNDRQRAMAMDLASGLGTGEVARKHGVTPGAVSQFRTRFRLLLDRFHEAA